MEFVEHKTQNPEHTLIVLHRYDALSLNTNLMELLILPFINSAHLYPQLTQSHYCYSIHGMLQYVQVIHVCKSGAVNISLDKVSGSWINHIQRK